jgi:hypothetical protein
LSYSPECWDYKYTSPPLTKEPEVEEGQRTFTPDCDSLFLPSQQVALSTQTGTGSPLETINAK